MHYCDAKHKQADNPIARNPGPELGRDEEGDGQNHSGAREVDSMGDDVVSGVHKAYISPSIHPTVRSMSRPAFE